MEAVLIKQTDVTGADDLAGQTECVSVAEFMQAVEQLRSEAAARGLSDMTMEEIDEEIAACRRDRRARLGK